jgi:fatty acid desaturase
MVNQENINLKLEMEALKVDQELQKKKNREDERKQLTNSWNAFLGCGAFGVFLVFMAIYQHGAWWVGVVVMALLALLGLWGIISKGSKVKNLEREIARLEKRKRELKNSVRW